MILETVLSNPWVRALGVVLALALVCLVAYALSAVLVPLLLALLVAYILDPVVDVFERLRVRRGISIAAFACLALILIASIPLYGVPSLITESQNLIEAARTHSQEPTESQGRLQTWGEKAIDSLPLERFVTMTGWRDPAIEDKRNAKQIIAERIGRYIQDNASLLLRNYGARFASAGQSAGATVAAVAGSIGKTIVNLGLFLANVAIFAFVAGYLLKDFDGLVASARELIPPRYRSSTIRIVGKIDDQVRSFLRGQLTVCFCMGVLYTIGFSIADVPFALIIGFLGGLAGFLPYVGPILVFATASALTLFQHSADWHLLAVFVTFGVVQFLEGSVLTPQIVGNKVGLHPVWVILAVLVFSSTLGFVGLLAAVPLAASLKVIVVELIESYKRSPLFVEDGPSATRDSEGN